MAFLDDLGERLKAVGLQTVSDVVSSAGNAAVAAIGGNDVKKDIPVVQTNANSAAAAASVGASGLSSYQIAGISLPVMLLIAAGAYFMFKKGR